MELADLAAIYAIAAHVIGIAETVARWIRASRTHGKRKGR